METADWIIPIVGAAMTVWGVIAFWIGIDRGEASAQHKAVQAGVWRWEIDPVTGVREFVYVVPQNDTGLSLYGGEGEPGGE